MVGYHFHHLVLVGDFVPAGHPLDYIDSANEYIVRTEPLYSP